MSYQRELFVLSPKRAPISSLKISFDNAVERSYAALSVVEPLSRFTAIVCRVATLFERLLQCFCASPRVCKCQISAYIDPTPFPVRVSYIEGPVPAARADAHAQA